MVGQASGVGSSDSARDASYTSWGGTDSTDSDHDSSSDLSIGESLSLGDTTEERLSDRETERGATQSPTEPTIEESDAELASAVAGIAGAAGREQAVQGVLDRSYHAGFGAPQADYQGSMHRGSPSAYEDAALGYEHSQSGRYHAPGQHSVYGAPTQAGAVQELSVYPTDQARTYTEFDLDIQRDPRTGTGGVADISAGLRQQNLPESALTQPSHSRINEFVHDRILGEPQYSAPQQAGKGAIDAGAAAIRAPSAVGGSQIDLLPANADPASVTPLSRQTLTPDGTWGPVRAASSVSPMPAYQASVTPGVLDMPAGSAGRASSMRYGAAGGAVDALVDAGVNLAQGNEVDLQGVATNVGTNAVIGAGATRAVDALTPRLGMVRAGGAVGGAIQATVSGYTNYQAYQDGTISGERAVASTIVDTGTAVAAGATGAAAGAVIGSVVPVAGTAVGAVGGFVVGVGAHYAIQAVDSVTGFTDTLKDGLTSGLESVGRWASSWW